MPIRSVIIPIINAMIISNPAPFPLAQARRKILVRIGPSIKTKTKFIRNTQSQNILNNNVSGITANTKPLIQGIADIHGTSIYPQ